MKKLIVLIIFLIVFIILLSSIFAYDFINDILNHNNVDNETYIQQDSVIENKDIIDNESKIDSIDDFKIYDVDGNQSRYSFKYGDETFYALREYQNWTIVDSYKINNEDDMRIIVEKLIEIYPIASKDYSSYRSVEDMVNEWQIHNIVYYMLGDDHPYKSNSKDVDFNPEDQGKTLNDFIKEAY